ncbi:hypothetical protein CY35_11G118600 [Sphagnum magellanicum]|nr:hypothetical protein CY35_11G118600 [Sphagnum magellanicum]
MKYGKLLQTLLEDLPPEFRDKFLSYKQLKKRIKQFLDSNSFPEDAFEPAPIQDHQELVHKPTVLGSGLLYRENPSAVHGDNIAEENANLPPGLKKVETLELVHEDRVREKPDGASEREEVLDPIKQSLVVDARQGTDTGQAIGEEDVTVEEKEFIRLLNVELEKFNSFFTEKEEDYVIQLQELKHRLESARVQYSGHMQDSDASEELLKIHTDLVTFHGEVVLMENYSALNYTGLVKILKKHDKRTGAVLRLPFIRRVLLQPFFSTELLSMLVQDCESLLSFFPPLPTVETCAVQRADGEGWDSNAEVPRDVQELLLLSGEDAQNIYKSSMAALRTLKEMRKRSSTVSSQSLPPCKFSRNETIDTVMNETLKPAPAVFVSQAL